MGESDENTSPESGVDTTLIEWMLSLSPIERLAALQDQIDSILALRNARISSQAS